MDITGARRSLAGAEAVLELRAVVSKGDYEECRAHHTQREHLRVHAIRVPRDPRTRRVFTVPQTEPRLSPLGLFGRM
jgi:hypothetical protein